MTNAKSATVHTLPARKFKAKTESAPRMIKTKFYTDAKKNMGYVNSSVHARTATAAAFDYMQ